MDEDKILARFAAADPSTLVGVYMLLNHAEVALLDQARNSSIADKTRLQYLSGADALADVRFRIEGYRSLALEEQREAGERSQKAEDSEARAKELLRKRTVQDDD
jgi:hypothetical protein